MHAVEISFKDWRNLADVTLNLDSAVNIFLGRNAQGKTNILEAINFASLLKSRAGKEAELIRWGQSVALLRIRFRKAGVSHELAIEVSMGRPRRLLLDANPIRPRELLGKLNSVMFSPEDLFMFKGAPSTRRKFLDAQIAQAAPIYFLELSKYTRLVEVRNVLLKRIRDGSARAQELDLWDEQLADFAARVISRRLAAVDKLNQLANSMQQKISAQTETFSVSYDLRGLDGRGDIAANFLQELRARRLKDIRYGSTSIGAHLDDLKFHVNGRELKLFGSQGQMRTAALALKLSELEFLRAETNEYPLLLLDDVMSELDALRREQLLEFLSRERIQTLITATDRAYFPPRPFGKIFQIESGRLIT